MEDDLSKLIRKLGKEIYTVATALFAFFSLYSSVQPNSFFADIPFFALCCFFIAFQHHLPTARSFNVARTLIGLSFVIFTIDYTLFDSQIPIFYQELFYLFSIAMLTHGMLKQRFEFFFLFCTLFLLYQLVFIVILKDVFFWEFSFVYVLALFFTFFINKFKRLSIFLNSVLIISFVVFFGLFQNKDALVLWDNLFISLFFILLGFLATTLLSKFSFFDFKKSI